MKVNKLLCWLGITNWEILSLTSPKSIMTQQNYGIFVLLTAIFSYISGYLAIKMVFGDWDPIRNQFHLSLKLEITCVLIALLYAFMIMMINREIVAAHSKSAILFRIPLAIVIGVIISVPLKMRILDDKINNRIYEHQVQNIAPGINEKNKFVNSVDNDISDLYVQIAFYTKKIDDARSRRRDEDLGMAGQGLSGTPGQGKLYRLALEEEEAYKQTINKLENLIKEKKEYSEKRLKEMDKDFQQTHQNESFGFWERYLIMSEIIDDDSTDKAKWMAYGLSALFILFELIPSIMKLINGKSEYEMMEEFYRLKVDDKLKHFTSKKNQEYDSSGFIILPEIMYEI